MPTPHIYFAGVNTNPLCDAFAGFRVLESFADVRGLMDRHRPMFESMCLDSGAYTVERQGKKIDLGEFTAFAQVHGFFYDFVASLDVIGGTPDENIANWRHMLDRGVKAIPTFHQGEPWSLLRDYCASAPMIGLGVQRPGGRMPQPDVVRAYLDECFTHIPESVRVHGWGMTNYTNYPFWSVDSTTWMFEVKALQGVKGQGAAAMKCLTPSELVEIVQKKYARLAKQAEWAGVDAEQMEFNLEAA